MSDDEANEARTKAMALVQDMRKIISRSEGRLPSIRDVVATGLGSIKAIHGGLS